MSRHGIYLKITVNYISKSTKDRRTKMTAADTALLVIDAQESFRHRPYYREADVPAFVERVQKLIVGAKAAGIPIVQIFHVEDNGPLSESSGFVTTLAPLVISSDAVFRKRRHSALVGSGLDVWLNQNGIRRLIVSGIRTEQCCETTTRHASDLGYSVDYVGEATLTFPMTDAAGREWSAAEIRARTELVLAGRFARIASVEEALAALSQKIAA
jgi:nicotinamidase-related amidase